LTGTSILIVDDDGDLIHLLGILLRSEGATVVAAASAREAVAVLERQPIDVLVSDINMPAEDGIWLIKKIRKSFRAVARRLIAVAVTGEVKPGIREQALSGGFDAFVAKPIDLSILLEKIATARGCH
jgi:CheY-like chemotaxis protein